MPNGMMGLGMGGDQGGGLRGQPDQGQMLQALMQRLAPLQQQNPQAYQMIMAKIQERMAGGIGQGFANRQGGQIGQAMPQMMPQQAIPQGMPQGIPQGMPQQAMVPQGMPQQAMLPQLAMLQQQNPQVYQAIMQRLGTGPSPVGPDSQFMNRFPNRAPAQFPNPMRGT